MESKLLTSQISRRAFLKHSSLAALAAILPGGRIFGDSATQATDVWVFFGRDYFKLMDKAMETVFANGGFGTNVKTLTLKVNAAWTRTPDQGANTHPVLVDSFLKNCTQAGIKKILVPEHPCRSGKEAFPKSGILQVVKKHNAKMIDLGKNKKSFKKVELPKAKKLNTAQVAAEYLDTDAIVNIPVAKHHSGAKLSMAMKNWMGVVKDRGFWHRNSLHQCIADFSTFIKPNWTFVDATRTMMDGGPQGPGKLKHPHLLIVSKDQVAADAYASGLFHDSVNAVKYLRIARDMKLGQTDVKKMNVRKINVG